MRLKIIHTNDIHSNFDNFARAATLIKQLKDSDSIVLDGGDFADFKSIELQGTKGMAALELLEYVGYDALTIGNNEMFNGVDTLQFMASTSTLPFISNNLLKKDRSKLEGVVKSAIIEKNGLRILITGSSPDLDVFNDGLGVHMVAFKESIKDEIKRNEGRYDLCILLSHIGTFEDEPLTSEIPEIDVIISAHDHQLYPSAKIVNGIIMNSAGNFAEHVGVVELEITDGHVKLIHSENLPTADHEMDESVLRILKENKVRAIEVLSEPLYNLSSPLWHDVIEENPISNLIADGLRDQFGCDIGLINSGIVNAGAFDFISKKKLIEICPSPLNPTSFEVKGASLREAFEQSMDVQACLADGRGPGFRGRFVGRLHVSGAEVIHDGKRVLDILIGGVPLDDEKWYSVASSDYLQRGSGYPALANNRNVVYRPEEIKDIIREYAALPKFVESSMVNRWSVLSIVNL